MSTKLTGDLRNELRWHALRSLYRPRAAPLIVESTERLFPVARDAIGGDTPILYLEFGVAHGASMNAVIRLFTNPGSHFVGFDSFEGLPEAWLMHERGAFSNRGQPPTINDERVSFVKGWFQNVVPDALGKILTDRSIHSAVLIHFDADLYSSTLFLLTTLWHVLPEFWFIFDDFIHDDIVALYDFTSTYPVEMEFLAHTRGGGDPPHPDHVFGRLRRTTFDPDRELPAPISPAL
jgi:O-methyltransferase